MDNLSIMAAGGLRARVDALELLANNIANAATPGYKADREFYDVYVSAEAAANGAAAEVPDVRRSWLDLSQGNLVTTGNSNDLAISGGGFFRVDGPTGPLLTRNGSFRVGAAGELTTPEGYALRSATGERLRVDPKLPVVVSSDGTVSQAGSVMGRLEVVDASPELLSKQGHGYFRISDASKLRRGSGELLQGKLESANISPAESAVRLVSVMRQFEMLQKAIGIGADMNRKAVEDVARVSA